MLNHKQLGKIGEIAAKELLQKKGYMIREMNFTHKIGEIDIIASSSSFLVFVEVKTRKNLNYGRPLEAVSFKKVEKIKRLALLYIQKTSEYNLQPRFDVVEVISNGKDLRLNHIENAF